MMSNSDIISCEEQNIIIAHINCRSLINTFDDLRDYILMQDLDIVGITETWLKPHIISRAVEIPGYTLFRADRDERRGGGVAFYVRLGIHCNSLMNNLYALQENSVEQLWIEIKLNNRHIVIGVVYRPPNVHYSSLSSLDDSLSAFMPLSDEIILLGDLNINMLKPNLPAYNFLNDILQTYNLKQIVTEPTRIANQTSSLIDIIASTKIEHITKTGTVHMPTVSDHLLIYCCVECPVVKNKVKFIKIRDFKKLDSNLLFEQVVSTNWNAVKSINNIEDQIDYLNQNIIALFDQFAPIKTIKISKPPAPWLTEVIKLMIKLRNNAYSKYKQSLKQSRYTPEQIDSKWIYYKQLRNLVTSSVRREKKAYMEYTLEKYKSNSRLWWKTVENVSIYNKKNIRDIPHELQNPDDFNNFFINSIPITQVPNITIDYYKDNLHENIDMFNLFEFREVTTEEVEKAINYIKSNAAGVDNISLKMIKLCLPAALDAITHIINFSLMHGTLPNIWKCASVIPIAKINKPQVFKDFRPISLLPVLAKILERIVYLQLLDFTTRYDLLPCRQSGFRAKHSTMTVLVDVVDEYIKAIDQSKVTTTVLLDYSKAFDCLNHKLLLAKLSFLGMSNRVIDWFESYLCNRSQQVKVTANNVISESTNLTLKSGVPQGSLLGPILFVLYMFDIHKEVKYCMFHSYADDQQISLSYNPSEAANACVKINEDLQRLAQYSAKHGLVLNAKKTNSINIGSKKLLGKINEADMQLKVNGNIISSSKTVKNLGIIFDSHLTFNEHVVHTIQTCYSKLRYMYQFKYILSKKVKLKLIESLVLSVPAYGDVVYGPCLTNHVLFKLQKMQNSCVRFATLANRRDHISPILKECHTLNMKKRWILHLCCLTQSILNCHMPTYLRIKIKVRGELHGGNLRQAHNILHIPQHKTTFFKSCFSYAGINFYNKIPLNIKSLSYTNFKKKVKNMLLDDSLN